MTEITVETVETQARKALYTSGIHDLSKLTIEQQAGQLLISGSVSRFYYKQLAQELVLGSCREVGLINSIDVR